KALRNQGRKDFWAERRKCRGGGRSGLPTPPPAASNKERLMNHYPTIRSGRAILVASAIAIAAGLLMSLSATAASASTYVPGPITPFPPVTITPPVTFPPLPPPVRVAEGCPTSSGHNATVRWSFIVVLNRCPDAGAFSYWSTWLNTHSSADLVYTLSQS